MSRSVSRGGLSHRAGPALRWEGKGRQETVASFRKARERCVALLLAGTQVRKQCFPLLSSLFVSSHSFSLLFGMIEVVCRLGFRASLMTASSASFITTPCPSALIVLPSMRSFVVRSDFFSFSRLSMLCVLTSFSFVFREIIC